MPLNMRYSVYEITPTHFHLSIPFPTTSSSLSSPWVLGWKRINPVVLAIFIPTEISQFLFVRSFTCSLLAAFGYSGCSQFYWCTFLGSVESEVAFWELLMLLSSSWSTFLVAGVFLSFYNFTNYNSWKMIKIPFLFKIENSFDELFIHN